MKVRRGVAQSQESMPRSALLAGESSFVRKSQSVESPGRISHNQTGIANLSDQAYDWVRSNHDHLSYTLETSKQREMSELFEVNHNGRACSPNAITR